MFVFGWLSSFLWLIDVEEKPTPLPRLSSLDLGFGRG
jgi:hypothetical protein